MNGPIPFKEQFAATMAEHGLRPGEIVADGKLHRFDGPDDKRGKRSAWYVLHDDGLPAGSFGDWRTGLSETWSVKPDYVVTHAERQAYRQRIEQGRSEAAADRAKVAEEAAAKCCKLWSGADAVQADHPYVKRKNIVPAGAKQRGDTLLVPLRDSDGVLRSLQFIRPDGSKRFKFGGAVAGCYCAIGAVPSRDVPLLVAEGWATACSLHESTGYPVAAAMNAGNLLAVAQALRAKLPEVRLVICADDDQYSDGNPGLTKAREAAQAVNALLAVPDFGSERLREASDFNDMHVAIGTGGVVACIAGAKTPGSAAAANTKAVGGNANSNLFLVQAAIAKTLAGDAGALFEVLDALRQLRDQDAANYARMRARIRTECRNLSIGELERQMRADVDVADEKSAADMLIDLVGERCELFHDPDNTAYALLDSDGHRQCWPVRSDGFREWLAFSFYRQYGRGPTEQSIKTALSTIEGQAKFDGEERHTFLRVASVGDSVWIDLCNDDWQAVEVTENGWRVVDNPPLHFVRTATMRALPMPTAGGSVDPLWAIINIPDRERLMVMTWILECFRSATPYAVLELTGEQGSAKSTTQQYLRELIDPNRSNNRAAPKAVDDVFVAAQNAHLMSFENLSYLPASYQDALCILATGGGYSTRRLFTNSEESVVDLKKPIALNGIAVVVTAQDLSDRAVHIDLPTVESRATANEIERAFETHKCGIFGGLLDVFSRTLATLKTVCAENLRLPRMADFAQLGEAVYRVHGKPSGAFLAEYQDRRKESVYRTIEASPVGVAMLAYLEEHPEGFDGTIGRLLEVLTEYRQDTEAWPKSAKGMGDMFQRLAPALRQIGISATKSDRRGKHGYQCQLKRIPEPNVSLHGSTSRNEVHQVHHVHRHPLVLTDIGELDEHGEHGLAQEHRKANMSGLASSEIREDV